jgi:hypothetical protein
MSVSALSIVPRERIDSALQKRIEALEAALGIAAANFETVEAQRDRYHDEVTHLRKRIEMADQLIELLRKPAIAADTPISTELTAHERATLVLATVAQRHGLTPEDIRGPRRGRRYAEARFEAIKAVDAICPGWSLPDLGAFFHRDHSTIHTILTAPRAPVPSHGRPMGTPAPWAIRHPAETVIAAITRVRAGENISVVARDMSLPRQTVRGWVKGSDRKSVTQ